MNVVDIFTTLAASVNSLLSDANMGRLQQEKNIPNINSFRSMIFLYYWVEAYWIFSTEVFPLWAILTIDKMLRDQQILMRHRRKL